MNVKMKKILFGIFIFINSLILIGCQESKKVPTEEEIVSEVIAYIDNEIPLETDVDIVFPTAYIFDENQQINIELIDISNKAIDFDGKIKQYMFDNEVELFFLIYGGPIKTEHEVIKKLIVKGTEDIEGYRKIIESYIPDYIYKDIELVYRDKTYKDKNQYGNITYTSSDNTILTDDGKYVNTNAEDQKITISYNVSINYVNVKGSKEVTVEGRQDDHYISCASEWLTERYSNVTSVFNTLDLPVTDDLDRVYITWESNDPSIISHSGTLVSYEANKKVTMTATIRCNDTTSTWSQEFSTYTTDNMLKFITERMHRDELNQYNQVVYAYTAENYGYLPFYVQDIAMESIVLSTSNESTVVNYCEGKSNQSVSNFNVTTGLIPWNNPGRAQTKKTSTNFITVHDTGDADHSAKWWNDLETTLDDRETSWNFTVGETDIYQHVPLDEVAWHAADGSTKYGLNDTGVKYEGPDPVITVEDDHYLYINGKKSKIKAPTITANIDGYKGQYATEITPAGLYTCRGDNGNYYMDNIYASNYAKASRRFYISNCGGNRNSIGIETCITKGIDYNQVMRNTANLIGHLLTYFNITPNEIMQHRSFCGKLCPQVMIENYLWDDFVNVCENEYIIAKFMSGIKFEYNSHNKNILSDTGKILVKVNEPTTVSYDVTVTYNNVSQKFTYSTIINPIK